MNTESIWEQALEQLKDQLKQDALITLRALIPEPRGQDCVLLAPNKYILETIKKDYWHRVVATLEALQPEGSLRQWHLELETSRKTPSLSVTAISPSETETERFQNHVRADYRFDNFVAGHSNEHAFAAAQAIAQAYNDIMNPLLIYGNTGLGKSHLLHAIGNGMLQRGLKKVLYISGEDFVNTYINALHRQGGESIQELTKRFRSLDALLIDDVQFLADKQRSQIEFFNTFNSLFDSKRQIVLASDRYPRDIEGLEERLKSRFGHGLTVSVEQPELETRIAIVLQKARAIHCPMPQEVAHYLAENIASNIRELEGAVRTLFSRHLYEKKALDLDLARQSISEQVQSQRKQTNVHNIQKAVAQYYQVSVSELTMKGRGKAHIVLARQVAMSLAKDIGGLSYPQIGEAFGRDHSTVIHAYSSIQERCKQDEEFAEHYRNLQWRLTR